MNQLTHSFARAIASLFTPAMLKIVILSLLVTIGVLFGFVMVASSLFAALFEGSWVLALTGSFGAAALAWFLFPGIMPVIINFFDQRIIGTIERQDYPQAQPMLQTPFLPELLHDMRFTCLVLALNIMALPFYLFPPLFPIIFYGMNGYLLGREFFIMVARRHLPIADAHILRRRYRWLVTFAGIALTIMATIPILNLIAPLWGMAVMTHLYQRLPKPDVFPLKIDSLPH